MPNRDRSGHGIHNFFTYQIAVKKMAQKENITIVYN
jgi:hypothetical protein